MLISPAVAAHFTPASEGGGGAIALSIILAVGIALFLVYLGQKRWRRRKPRRDGNGE
jgi:membrane protein implicated in regulation of membrane protease activity